MKPNGNNREVVLNIETTGFEHKGENPDCIIEIGAVELIDRIPGKEFHRFVNPNGVSISKYVTEKTGLSNENLEDVPRFSDPSIVDQLLNFIGDSRIVTHNVSLDRSFLNAEVERAKREIIPEERWIDTLELARNLYPSSKNSLPKLCERFKISLESRKEREGGLIDCKLLVKVYQELNEYLVPAIVAVDSKEEKNIGYFAPEQAYLAPALPLQTSNERIHHRKFLLENLGSNCIWTRYL